jgi:hypothetical protein
MTDYGAAVRAGDTVATDDDAGCRGVKRGVVRLLTSLGCYVYHFDQPEGLPDLFVLWPHLNEADTFWVAFWVEVNRPGGRRSAERVQFAARVMAAGGVVLCAWETVDVVRFIERVCTAGLSPRAAALACLLDAAARGEKTSTTAQKARADGPYAYGRTASRSR